MRSTRTVSSPTRKTLNATAASPSDESATGSSMTADPSPDAPAPVDPADAGPESPSTGAEVVHEPRTVPQRRHDALVGILTAAAASTTAPTTGGAAPTLIVTTTIDDLDGGTCHTDGIDIPLPARLAHRIACTG